MTVSTDFTPYSTVRPLFPATLPSYVAGLDQERISAYQVYDELYWNAPATFKLVARGAEDKPIYIPSGRTIVEACNRFLMRDFDAVVNPSAGSAPDQQLLRASVRKLFAREEFKAKFNTQRRFGLVRGDALWHVVADDTKPEGSRISLLELDPGSYFPITHDDDIDKIIGCHLIDTYAIGDKTHIRRQTYRKVYQDDKLKTGEVVGISSECIVFETDKWDDREGGKVKAVQVLTPLKMLPPEIRALPVYHIKNWRTPLDPFGSSELRGLERIAGAINQSISDEELALALEGLGVYVTTSGPPVDENGEESDWRLGPGRVVEIDRESDFTRVTGVSSVTAWQDHIRYLQSAMREGSGTPDIAIGTVDVAIAESGIALALKMGPILAKNAEKEDEQLAKYDQMFFDLVNAWLPAYERYAWVGVELSPVVGQPLPIDRKAVLEEILGMLGSDPPLISAAYARHLLAQKLGYEFPEEMGVDIVQETAAMTEARGLGGDAYVRRIEAELGAEGEGTL